jgi:hypothetical protein
MTEQNQIPDPAADDTEGHIHARSDEDASVDSGTEDTEGHIHARSDEDDDDTEGHVRQQ